MSKKIQSKNSANRYTLTAAWLHVILAVAILIAFFVGIYMVDLPFSPSKLRLYNWHKWTGMGILFLSIVRFLWRFTHPPPPMQDMVNLQKIAQKMVLWLMYILFFCVPLLGWAYSSASGLSIVWLGVLPLPDWVPIDPNLAKKLRQLHEYTAMFLMGLAALHSLAALKHHLFEKNNILSKMSLFRV